MTCRPLLLAATSGLVAALAACVVSREPVVTASAAPLDSTLLGAWVEVGGTDRATVSRVGDRYAIDYRSEDGDGRLEARLGMLGGRRVLDVWPAPKAGEVAAPYAGVMLAGHLLFAVGAAGDDLTTAAHDADTLAAALRAGRVRLPHDTTQGQLVLGGTTAQLRAALGPHLGRAGALGKPDLWKRASLTSAGPLAPVAPPCFEAAAWREADRMFHRDGHWVGADGASSVDMGGGRTLWLFGDTWIDTSRRGTRHGATMVSNSVAIQTGTDPSTASIAFYWGKAANGAPAAFFPDRRGESLWLGNGVRVGDRLVVFLERVIRNTGTGLGFASAGWTAVLVENPDDAPSAWRWRELETPANPLGVDVGYAAVVKMGDTVYVLGSADPVKSHPIYAVRWTADALRRGDLMHPAWWAGDRFGWVPDSSGTRRWPLFENGSSDLTVHLDPVTGRYLEFQPRGFGPADIVIRAAPSLTGPWSDGRLVYRPPEYDRPNVMIYSAKAHPELSGGDLVLTYATNTFQFAEQLSDRLIYYPRFVRLTRCR